MSPPASFRRAWRDYWPLGPILLLAAFLLFTGLHRDYLWADEGDTAVLAKSILKFGVPTAWDGVSFIDSDYGARLNDDLVMVSHPWLQYYVTAAAFAAFGETALAARVPFALMSLATVALIYLTILRVTANRWTAASAAILLTVSVQFLLYGRQSRHYALNALLTCLLVLQFTRLKSWTNSILFAIIGILLFHSHPIAIASLVTLGLITLVYAPFREQRRWFWRAAPIIAAFTLPWMVLARRGYAQSTGVLQSVEGFLPRFGQFAIECASVTSMVGAIILFVIVRRRHQTLPAERRTRRASQIRTDVFTPRERHLLVVLLAIMAAYAVVMALTQPPDEIFALGVRYTPAVLPFMAMITALLVSKVSRGNWRPWVALLVILSFTKLGRLTPWVFWETPSPKRDPAAVVTFHNPKQLVDRVFRTGQAAFVQSLFEENVGTTGQIIRYLNANAAPQDIVVTNYGWEPLYFHTGLRQGLTVLSSYPIYAAAKARGLPDYVFRADGARWIVWRKAWADYRGHHIENILAQLEAARIPVRLVETIPETLWENRPNVHFRRFPGNRYIYSWFNDVPETLIYRVDQPKAGGGSVGSPNPG